MTYAVYRKGDLKMWIMEVLVKGEWRAVRPTGGDPYKYETKEEAEDMLRMCYPDQVREIRLGGDPEVRVREVNNV